MPALKNLSPFNGGLSAGTRRSADVLSPYEQSREERIRENLEKMQKLGIFDLSLNLKLNSNENLLRSRVAKRQYSKGNKTPPSVSPLLRSEPTRRSTRLKNGTPVSYSEVESAKKNKVALFDDEDLLSEEGKRPEIYTEEHEKLLGSTERSWTLFVDGCGNDGKRIYDPVKGKTCHQCRQKTLGYRTHCTECNKVQGQFCGDCLYMRYGEHVLEAMGNPAWICPVCRGICNCSLCRQANGWAPTGALYKKVTRLGYKSVAHYLIQTRRTEANPVNNQDAANEVSVKRSLAFSDMEAVSKDLAKVTDDQLVPSLEVKDKTNDEFQNDLGVQDSAKRSLRFSDETPASEAIASQIVAEEKILDEKKIDGKISLGKEMEQEIATPPMLKRVSCTSEIVNSDSIAERLKKRRTKSDDCDEELLETATKGVLPENEVEKQKEAMSSDVKNLADRKTPLTKTPKLKQQKLALAIVPSEDSIAGRLRKRRGKSNDCDEEFLETATKGAFLENETENQKEVMSYDVKRLANNGNTPLAKTPKLKQKLALAIVPSEDSIAGRLRKRRTMAGCE